MEWSLLTRGIEAELVPLCAELGISIVAYSPLARALLAAPSDDNEYVQTLSSRAAPRFTAAALARNRQLVEQIKRLGATKGASPAQLSLAWLYARAAELGVEVVAIPGTQSLEHLLEDVRSLGVSLSPEEMRRLEVLGATVVGARAGEQYMAGGYESVIV